MSRKHRRITRDKKTIESMMHIYCRNVHGPAADMCTDCRELLSYAMKRLEKCPFQAKKTTCANCRVHCYRPSMREKMKQVMRYAGPRMTYRHPFLALLHFLDGFRKGQPNTTNGN